MVIDESVVAISNLMDLNGMEKQVEAKSNSTLELPRLGDYNGNGSNHLAVKQQNLGNLHFQAASSEMSSLATQVIAFVKLIDAMARKIVKMGQMKTIVAIWL